MAERLTLWLLRRFRAFRELEEWRHRHAIVCHGYEPRAALGTQRDLEHQLYVFLAEHAPLGVQVVVHDTQESEFLLPGIIAAQLIVPKAGQRG